MLNGEFIVGRLIQIMPGVESVTLGIRGIAEAGYTSATFAHTHRRPTTKKEVAAAGGQMGEEWLTFELYKTTETATPKLGDKITDAFAIVWQVKDIDVMAEQTVFICHCLRNK